MLAIRFIGLVSIAVLTMGSGAPGASNNSRLSSQGGEPGTDPTAPINQPAAAAETGGLDVDAEQQAVPNPSQSSGGSAQNDVVPDDGSAVELAISNDYLQARYFTGGGLLGVDQARGHVGFYFSDSRDLIGNIGLMSDPVPLLNERLTISAGMRGYLALLSDPDDDVFGLAPGAEARYALPFAYPVDAVGSIFYAPDILTLGDATSILDLDIRAEAQIIPSAVGFIGYREFRFDSDEGADTKAASEIQLGARFNF